MRQLRILISSGILLAAASAPAPTPTPDTSKATASVPLYEMHFQFEQNGTASAHTFVLKWSGPDSNLESIDVVASGNKLHLQTLEIPPNKVHLIWRDLVDKPNQIKDKIADSVDYNFDKYGDFRLTESWPYHAGGKRYLIWLYDSKKSQYVLSQELSALPAPVVDEKNKLITSIELGGYGGGEYVEKSFSLTSEGKLHLEVKVTQKIDEPEDFSFIREVRARVDGELQRVCKIQVPSVGKLKLTWGDPSRCDAYMRKGAPNLYQSSSDQPNAKRAKNDKASDEADDEGDSLAPTH